MKNTSAIALIIVITACATGPGQHRKPAETSGGNSTTIIAVTGAREAIAVLEKSSAGSIRHLGAERLNAVLENTKFIVVDRPLLNEVRDKSGTSQLAVASNKDGELPVIYVVHDLEKRLKDDPTLRFREIITTYHDSLRDKAQVKFAGINSESLKLVDDQTFICALMVQKLALLVSPDRSHAYQIFFDVLQTKIDEGRTPH